ncbi:MAG: helix-turn-helix transcriptional regulator [Oscillospiraceae bacterium]|nr:helix-turn-helix transcriptional regulator [Oscillospiraceae bacterium]
MKIRELREAAGLSKTDVAREMGVDLAAVSRWDSGESMPRAAKLPKLAELFHCSIDELFRDPETQKPPARPGA